MTAADTGLVAELTDRILTLTRDRTWDDLRDEARTQARASFDVTAVCDRFGHLLVEDLPPADVMPPGDQEAERVQDAVG